MDGPTAHVGVLSLRIGSHLMLFCICQMNWMDSRTSNNVVVFSTARPAQLHIGTKPTVLLITDSTRNIVLNIIVSGIVTHM